MNGPMMIEKCANGWIVREPPNYTRDSVWCPDGFMVFESMDGLLAYIKHEMGLDEPAAMSASQLHAMEAADRLSRAWPGKMGGAG